MKLSPSNTSRLLLHETFLEQYTGFLEKHIERVEALNTQLKKSRDHPTAGKVLHAISVPALRSKLYRMHVAGRRGFRYIYFYQASKAPGQSIVLPIFISPDIKSNFDYDKASSVFECLAEQIVEDLKAKNWTRFKEFQLV